MPEFNEREYNIILHKEVDYDLFWEDLKEITEKDNVPNRQVEIANPRLGSYRQTHYWLTEAEKDDLLEHPSVLDIEIPPEQRNDIVKEHGAIISGSYNRSPSLSSGDKNWGLLRCNTKDNTYNGNEIIDETYNYTLDGKGVDVVIVDSGVQTDHPEWEDQHGVSRYTFIDWGSIHTGFTQNANHERDNDGHGTHCAGIAAGKTFGWAKNAKIYSLKIRGLEGSGDGATGIDDSYALDAIKLFHRQKAIDPATGYKRPTVVNMSWGYSAKFTGGSTAYAVNYRGTSYSSTVIQNSFGGELKAFGLNEFAPSIGLLGTWKHPVRITSVDTDIEEMVEEGIHVIIASGNSNHKIDVPSGADYNNQALIKNTQWRYYSRGSSPYSDKAFMVGCIDEDQVQSGSNYIDKRASFSNHGPGVNIYAPGSRILSSVSNTSGYARGSYTHNGAYWESILNGTSMAAPQVCGVVALYAQSSPGLTPAKMQEVVFANASEVIYNPTEHLSGSYSLQADSVKMLHNKYGQNSPLTFSGSFTATTNLDF
jgi:subtilisin family serine protease